MANNKPLETCTACGKTDVKNMSSHLRFCREAKKMKEPAAQSDGNPTTPEQALEALMASPAAPANVAPVGVKPGTKVGTGFQRQKVRWTHQKMMEYYPAVRWEADETTTVQVNGVKYQLIAGNVYSLPSIAVDVLMNSRRETREAWNTRQPSDKPIENLAAGWTRSTV